MINCCANDARTCRERRLLWIVLILNALMFAVEFGAGWLARSSGLMADSLDMLADTLVYGLSLYAVGKGLTEKARAALVNGSLQLVLGLSVFIHIGWRIWHGSTPDVAVMGWIASLALLVNMLCFALLFQFRSGDVNLRASWLCSRNDMLANAGVLAAAWLVQKFSSPWPDWLIAAAIAGIVVHASLGIIQQALASLRQGDELTLNCCDDKR